MLVKDLLGICVELFDIEIIEDFVGLMGLIIFNCSCELFNKLNL